MFDDFKLTLIDRKNRSEKLPRYSLGLNGFAVFKHDDPQMVVMVHDLMVRSYKTAARRMQSLANGEAQLGQEYMDAEMAPWKVLETLDET